MTQPTMLPADYAARYAAVKGRTDFGTAGWAPRRQRRKVRAVRQRLSRRDRALVQVEVDQAQLRAIRRDLKAMGRDFDRELPRIVDHVVGKAERIMRRMVESRIGTKLTGKPRSTGDTARAVGKVRRIYAQIGGRRVWAGAGIIDGPRRNVASSRNLQRQDVHGWVEFGSRTQSGSKRRPRFYVRDTLRQYPPQQQVNDALRLARRLIDRSLPSSRWKGRA